MRLKPGELLIFDGANWKLAGDRKWRKTDSYMPNYMEKLVGVRSINGQDHAVFQCLDGEFGAQPKELCTQTLEDDPSLVESPEKEDIHRHPSPTAVAPFDPSTGKVKPEKKKPLPKKRKEQEEEPKFKFQF